MTEQHFPASPNLAASPYLSIRQAVRPLIFARALLARERGLAGQLAAECDRLARLTGEALEAAALVHLLSPEKNDPCPDDVEDSRRSEFIDAYVEAGTAWAEVVAAAIALADALLDSERVHDARRLADFLEAAGESAAAADLRARADAVMEGRLSRIHSTMTESEIAAAIETLSDSGDKTAVAYYMPSLAKSIAKTLPEEDYIVNLKDYNRVNLGETMLNGWYVKPGDFIPKGRMMCKLNLRRGYGDTHLCYIEFPAIISKLLIANGGELSDGAKVASVIRLPDVIAFEISHQGANMTSIFSRLDALARAFQRIQGEKARAGKRGT